MVRGIPLFGMDPKLEWRGVMPASGELRGSKIRQRIKEVIESNMVEYPIPNHPTMRPQMGFVDLVSILLPALSIVSSSFRFLLTGFRARAFRKLRLALSATLWHRCQRM